MTDKSHPEQSQEARDVITFRHRVPLCIDVTYALHPDRVVVTGSQIWVPKLEAVIWLRTLSLNTSTVWMRSAHFQWAMVVLFCEVMCILFVLPGAAPAFVPILIICTVLVLPVLAYACYTRRLIRYTHFLTNEGVNTLSISDAGPDRERYESFVQELIRRIQESQPSHK